MSCSMRSRRSSKRCGSLPVAAGRPDPDDDMVLEAAVNRQADAIVTFNVGDFGEAARRFGVEVLAPGAGMETSGERQMRKSNFALRLQPSLLDEARKVAEDEG